MNCVLDPAQPRHVFLRGRGRCLCGKYEAASIRPLAEVEREQLERMAAMTREEAFHEAWSRAGLWFNDRVESEKLIQPLRRYQQFRAGQG